MAQPTFGELHVDHPLSVFSQRFMNDPNNFAADKVFPIVPVEFKSDLYFVYTADYWFTDEMLPRNPGDPFAESGYGLSTASYNCGIFAIAKRIPDEIRKNVDDPIQPDREAAEWLATKALLNREVAFATDFFKTGVWTTDNTSASKWDDLTNGVPVTNVLAAQRTVLKATGLKPNILACSLVVWQGLKTSQQITNLIKYVERALPKDVEAVLANALDMDDVIVSQAVKNTAKEGATLSMSPVFGNSALVLYRTPRPSPYTAAGGLTFVWNPGGGMGVVERVRDDLRRSDQARVQACYDQAKVSADLGYFFSSVTTGT